MTYSTQALLSKSCDIKRKHIAIKCNASLGTPHNMTSPTWANPKVKIHRHHQGLQAISHPVAPQAQLGSLPDMLLADANSRIYQTNV